MRALGWVLRAGLGCGELSIVVAGMAVTRLSCRVGGFRGPRVVGAGVGFQPKAVRIRLQPVAIASAQVQVLSMRSRTCRAPRVMRAATCSTR